MKIFGIGRNSVREAIKILEAYGVVYIKRAEGTFVNDTYNHKMLDPMLYGILLDKNMRIDIIQVRKVLDTGMLYQIIGGITDEKMNQILKKFDNLKTVVLSENVTAKQVLQADVDFHLTLVESTENPILCNIHEYVDRITTPSREKNGGAGSGEESERDIHSASSKDNQSSSGKKFIRKSKAFWQSIISSG